MATELTPIKVVPHFMRLHEWIAATTRTRGWSRG
jgi:hypothetical protein